MLARFSIFSGAGRPNRKPCTTSQPAARSSVAWFSVSTPSAMVLTPSARDRPTIVETTAPELESVSMRLTKERSIFSLLEREIDQVAEVGIAGAEIVDGHRDAHVGKLLQDDGGAVAVLHHRRLGDFELQPRGLDAGRLRSPRCTMPTKSLVMNCTGEMLTATKQSSGRWRASLQALLQHPFADRHDHAGFLGDRDELHRRDHAAFRMLPADQRLVADDACRSAGRAAAGSAGRNRRA